LSGSSRFDELQVFWWATLDPRAAPGDALTISGPHGAAPVDLAKQGARMAVLGGSLHDRKALEAAARFRGPLRDAELVLRAYERVGREVVPLVRGDFALLIWDGDSRRLLAARDRVGVYPLFYAESDGVLHLSPSPEVIAGGDGVSPGFNELAIGEWVVLGTLDVSETFYRGVTRLPPGHVLELSPGRLRVSRYWDPREAERSGSWDPGDAFEQFDALLRQAVRRSLVHGAVGVFLSGGVDSATVAAIAAEESRAAGLSDPWALSMKFGHPQSDEEAAQRAIATDLGIPQIMLRLDEAAGPDGTVMTGLRAGAQSWFPLVNPWSANYHALIRGGVDRGCRAVLSGEGGNHWLEVDWGDAVPLLARLEISALRRFLRAFDAYYPTSLRQTARQLLWRHGLRRIAADSVCSAFKLSPRQLRRVVSAHVENGLPGWALPDESVRRAFVERQTLRHPCVTGARPRWRTELLTGSQLPVLLETVYLDSLRLGIPLRGPYFDADLVEFLFQAPTDILLYGDRFKGLAHASYRRRARGGSANRLRVASFGADFGELRATEMPSALGELGGVSLLSELGIVDRRDVELALRGTCDQGSISYYQAWQALACEAWLRVRV